MQVDLFGLTMETPGVTFYLWSPWRCSAIEHKLFDSLANLPNATLEREPDEVRQHIAEPKAWKLAVQNLSRVIKGWQEEGVDANEKRSWRWLLEADVDSNGYDHKGEKSAFWAFLRLTIDRGAHLGEPEKAEELDLNGFGICIWGAAE